MPNANDQEDVRPSAAERGRRSREKLLAAAVELIPELGWNAVTTRAVAARAGVRPGLVHYHFASVEALLRAAALSHTETEMAAPLRALTAFEDPAEGLMAALHTLDSYDGRDPGSVLIAEAYLAASRDPRLREGLGRVLSDTRAAITAWLERLGTPQAEAVAELVCAVLDGLLLHRGLGPVPSVDAYLEPLRRLTAAGPAPAYGRAEGGRA